MNFLLFAEDPAPQQPGGLFGSPMFPFFLIGLMLLFWVVVILPMSRRQKKEQEQLLANIKRGTKILTNAGIVATVVTANEGEDEIVIRSEDTKLRIKRNVVVQVLDASGAEPAKQ
jgi:preprotein translocase subunit YajC